jgi:DNA-binding protein YbaB
MNIYDMMKQFKNFQESMEQVKGELRQRKEVLEKEGIEIIYNGLGEVVDISVSPDIAGDWNRLKPLLIDLINEAQDRSREILKEELSRKFGGLLGGMGFGL